MRGIVKASRRPHRFARCRFACATGTAASQGFRTAHGFETGRMACDAPHRRATSSWPKALGNRLYDILSALLGIRRSRPQDSAIFIASRWPSAEQRPRREDGASVYGN